MLKKQISVDSLNPHRSIIDRLGIAKQQETIKQPKQEVIKEVYNTQPSNIDYTIIKAIIEECIDRKLNEHFKKQL